MNRIEVYERYVANIEEVEELENLGVPIKNQAQYRYRRTNPRMEDIDRIIEIEGNDQECVLLFYSGEAMLVKANFEELCITFNDLENGFEEDEN